MQRLFYFLLFTISMQLANAQGTTFQIRGRVLDENGEALPGTTLQTTDRQAVTDAAGRFNLDIPSKTGWLTVRCIGYFPQRISLDTLRFSGQLARLDIFLKSNAVNLPEIAISSKPMESVFQEDFRSNLLDYDFAGEDLLLLVQLGKKYFLQLTTDNGRLLTELQLPEPADLLHRSCTGDLHVVGEHHAREITLAGNRIDTFPRYTTDLFYKLVKPCVLEQNGYYFYQKTGAYRQSVQYLYYDPDRKQHLLAIIRNEIIEAQLRRRHMEILAAYMLTLSDLDRDDILDGYSPLTDPEKVLRPENLTRMAETNGLVANIGFFSTLAEDSVYAPLIKVGSRIYLLDHVNDKMLRIAMEPPGMIKPRRLLTTVVPAGANRCWWMLPWSVSMAGLVPKTAPWYSKNWTWKPAAHAKPTPPPSRPTFPIILKCATGCSTLSASPMSIFPTGACTS
ncbi:MAG: carboxypeptidase regulatory-like domain-containing protein [Lewinellaceae bacterium]|nr:carboxypeptidase regulatory-like domain-containing protein [Lewinellaceae bacterium]